LADRFAGQEADEVEFHSVTDQSKGIGHCNPILIAYSPTSTQCDILQTRIAEEQTFLGIYWSFQKLTL
jgi:hypothetical protein